MHTKHTKRNGFTLMEVLIYTAILSVTGTILSGVLLNTTKIKGRQTAVIEVNEQLNFVLQNIQRSIMDSSIIDIENSMSTSTLVLRYKDETKNPTKFYISDNIVYKQEAANPAQPLTDSSVVANAINFLKVSGYSGHDSLQIDLTLSYNTNNPVSAFSRTLSSAIARVSAATFDSDLVPGSSIHDIGTSENKWQNLYVSGITNFGGVNYTWPAADGTDGQNLSTNGLGVLSWASPSGYWSAFGNDLYNTNTGNIGIGTTTPTSMLTIGGASGTTGLSLQGNNLSCTVYPCIRTGGGGSLQINSSVATGAYGKLYLNNDKNSDVLIAGGGGNVGIGTTGPSQKLTVSADANIAAAANTAQLALRSVTNPAEVLFSGYDAITHAGVLQAMVEGSTFQPLLLNPSSGNVGIGTTNPGKKLDIAGSIIINSSGSIYPAGEGSDSYWKLGYEATPAGASIVTGAAIVNTIYNGATHGFMIRNSSGTSLMEVLGSNGKTYLAGSVGIGMTPSYQLQLSTDSAAKPSTNTWTIASDARIKKDIKPFTEGLSVINSINPVWYKYNGKGGFVADGKDYIGVIAQDIEKIAPYTVSSFEAKLNPDDTTTTTLYNFNSHALTFNLINAVKEQQQQIEELKNRISELEGKIK